MAQILRPKHINALWANIPLPGRTPQSHAQRHAAWLAQNPAASEPYDVDAPTFAYIGSGAWRVECACGEAPLADPEWTPAARCFGCGAVFTAVIFPSDWLAIETLLAKRRIQAHRNWHQPETYDDLLAEQRAHGDPV